MTGVTEMSRADRYANLGADYHWRWWVSRAEYRRWIGRLLSEFPSNGDGASVLNIGCGDGVPAAQLIARGFNVYGVDDLEEPLSIARSKVPSGVFSTEIPDSNFDYVLLSEDMKYFENNAAVIDAIKSTQKYSIVIASASAYSEYTMGRLFRNCQVELIIEEDDLHAYIVEPQD